MSVVEVVLRDGAVRQFEPQSTWADVAATLGRRLKDEALVARVDGRLVDLFQQVSPGKVDFLTFDDEEGRHVLRHSSAHLLAQAVKRRYPDARIAIGPAIADGFYYDFDVPVPFTPEDLERLEAEMEQIIQEKAAFAREVVSRAAARELFSQLNEPYKVELVEGLAEDAEVTIYRQGDFVDLCAGPHVPHSGKVGAVKLMQVAGAYWRGDERNKMLQRIYGTAFIKQKQLADYLHQLEEAKKRDHRRLGPQLDLFSLHEEGPGFPFFHPKGMVVRQQLEDFWRILHREQGYHEIRTPVILSRSLWEQSGHWEHYKENMYFTRIDDRDFAVKPMNCPGAMLVYRAEQHSYRELPLRLAELGLVHRHELSGVLHGLMRVRSFTQDDAHIFMLPEQVTAEIGRVVDLIDRIYGVFGFAYRVEISTRPEHAMGSEAEWERATNSLELALQQKGLDYKVNPGDGAFYGPKIDFHLQDSLGRTWQCGTIQLDFQMPEKFDLMYIGADGLKHRPVMIHRVIFGSLERFIGILTEHYAGAFPLWLAPVQVKILPVADRQLDYAFEVKRCLETAGIRVEVDENNEKLGYKIRQAQLSKIPLMLITGEQEVESNSVAVRHRSEGDLGRKTVAEFVALVQQGAKIPAAVVMKSS